MRQSRLVYTTESGRVNQPQTRRPAAASETAGAGSVPDDGVVRIFRERGSRSGKTVTVIRGLPGSALETCAAELKRLCGAGGTVKRGAIEIQGDHRERAAAHLRSLGYIVKLASG